MNWIKLDRSNPPTYKNKLYLFVQFTGRNKFIVQSFFGSLEEAFSFREHELRYAYTHYMIIPNLT